MYKLCRQTSCDAADLAASLRLYTTLWGRTRKETYGYISPKMDMIAMYNGSQQFDPWLDGRKSVHAEDLAITWNLCPFVSLWYLQKTSTQPLCRLTAQWPAHGPPSAMAVSKIKPFWLQSTALIRKCWEDKIFFATVHCRNRVFT